MEMNSGKFSIVLSSWICKRKRSLWN